MNPKANCRPDKDKLVFSSLTRSSCGAKFTTSSLILGQSDPRRSGSLVVRVCCPEVTCIFHLKFPYPCFIHALQHFLSPLFICTVKTQGQSLVRWSHIINKFTFTIVEQTVSWVHIYYMLFTHVHTHTHASTVHTHNRIYQISRVCVRLLLENFTFFSSHISLSSLFFHPPPVDCWNIGI